MSPKNNPRVNLSKIKLSDYNINLIEAHIQSFQKLIEEGLEVLFKEISPVEDYTGEAWQLKFDKLRLSKPKYSSKKAQKLGLSFDTPLYVNTILTNKRTGEIKEQELFVADLPLMTRRGTFVINGNERVVVMQLVRAEGILFVEAKKKIAGKTMGVVKLMPQRGRWLDFEVDKNGIMSVKLINKRPKILLTTLLRALGYSTDDDLRKLLRDSDQGQKEPDTKFVETTLKADTSHNTEEALIDIYSKLRPEDSINLDSAKNFLNSIFFNPRRFFLGKVGRYKLNKKLGINLPIESENFVLKKEDLVAIVKSLIKLNHGELRFDDIDHLGNRRVRATGELIGEKIREGMLRMEKNIKDRMSTYGADELIAPSILVNTRPIIAAINQFFGSSSVSRYMDQQNILSELVTKRRITSGGPGGLTKESATFSVRDVHSSHYSRLCPVETPEGPMIGIVSHMAIYARINEYGFIEAPYRKVVSIVTKPSKKVLLNRQLALAVKDNGKVIIKKDEMLTAPKVEKIIKLNPKEVHLVPYVTEEIEYLDPDDEIKYKIGPATISVDEIGNITQSNVFVRYYSGFANVPVHEINYIDVSPSQIAGLGLSLIPYAAHDDPTRTLMGANMQRQAVPLVDPETPIVGTGYEPIIAKSSRRSITAEEDCEVTYADAATVEVKYTGNKENVKYRVDKFIRTNQNTCFNQRVRVKKGDKLKKDDLIVDGPAMDHGDLALGKNILSAYMIYEGFNYEDGIIISERLVKDDVLTSVHIGEYVQDIRETKLGPEQITRDIPNVGEYSLRNLDESGIVRVGARVDPLDILVGVIAPKGETELTAEEKLLRAIFGEYARDVRDNSLRLPHGSKGIVLDVQVLSKEKGDKLNPGVITQVKVWVARTHKISIGDKLTGRHGDKGVISKVMPEEDMPYLEDGTPVDAILSPLFIKRMNLGQLMETHMGKIAQQLGIKIDVPGFVPLDEEKVMVLAKKEGVDTEQKVTVYDGRTGRPFEKKIVVGPRYILKLDHLASDKVHARSTGPYTMVTQQPLGGKAQFGGQRFGEMEVWALEAHAVPSVLHEMLTIKSDDVVGRANAYKSIIQGLPVEAPSLPESFKVLVGELRSLGLNLDMIITESNKKNVDQKGPESETTKEEGEDSTTIEEDKKEEITKEEIIK